MTIFCSASKNTIYNPPIGPLACATCRGLVLYRRLQATCRTQPPSVTPWPGLGIPCGCFAKATSLPPPSATPHRQPPTLQPCSFAALQPAALQSAALQAAAPGSCCMGSGVFCFREVYYDMYPVTTEDLLIARGHYLWTVDDGGSEHDLRPSIGGGW